MCDALGRQVAGRNYPPTNKNTLIRALTEEWDKLPQQLLDNVVQSMRSGHGYGSVVESQVRILMPHKFRRVVRLVTLNLWWFNVIRRVRSNSGDAQLAIPNDPRYAGSFGDGSGQGRVVTVRRQSCDTLAV
ncbi:hypothetical protein TNCV_2752341 [Trichonephila clavipes]|nr:hypothetical protein TNCV_2752341 [Trichonephila clavipes]